MPKTIKTARGLARFAKAPYASRRKSLPRHSFETRQKALAIFQAGGSYKNCAKTLNIPVYTARDWHRSFLIGTFRAEHGARQQSYIAKNGIFEVDDQTLAFVAEHSDRKPVVYKADEDAVYDEVIEIDLSEIKSTVAFPHLPGNTRTIDEVGEVKIDQVVIGSCTNGFYKDIEEAASIIRGKKVAKNVRAIIIPATQSIYLKAMENGLLKDFIEAGCVVSTPTCGPCLGGHMGILAAGERAVSTTNRNFVGRMGHPESEVYLASPAVAAASAIAGKIVSPKEVL